jgi:hypothetical protein
MAVFMPVQQKTTTQRRKVWINGLNTESESYGLSSDETYELSRHLDKPVATFLDLFDVSKAILTF